MQARNAARVLPDPVGAAIRVVRPARISGQPAPVAQWASQSGAETTRQLSDAPTPGHCERRKTLLLF